MQLASPISVHTHLQKTPGPTTNRLAIRRNHGCTTTIQLAISAGGILLWQPKPRGHCRLFGELACSPFDPHAG
jgi:hypothetical protein